MTVRLENISAFSQGDRQLTRVELISFLEGVPVANDPLLPQTGVAVKNNLPRSVRILPDCGPPVPGSPFLPLPCLFGDSNHGSQYFVG